MNDKNFKRFACIGFMCISVVVFCLGFMIGAVCYGADFVKIDSSQNNTDCIVASADEIDSSYSFYGVNMMPLSVTNTSSSSSSSATLNGDVNFVVKNNSVYLRVFVNHTIQQSASYGKYSLFLANGYDGSLTPQYNFTNYFLYDLYNYDISGVSSTQYPLIEFPLSLLNANTKYYVNYYYKQTSSSSSSILLCVLSFSFSDLITSFDSLTVSTGYRERNTIVFDTSYSTVTSYCVNSFYYSDGVDNITAYSYGSAIGYFGATYSSALSAVVPVIGSTTYSLGSGDSQSAYNEGYENGYEAGESAGYDAGYSDGLVNGDNYQAGYQAGYNAGLSLSTDVNNTVSPYYNSYVVGAVWDNTYYNSYHTDDLNFTIDNFTGYLSSVGRSAVETVFLDFESNTSLDANDYDFSMRYYFNKNIVGFNVGIYNELSLIRNVGTDSEPNLFYGSEYGISVRFNFVDINNNYVASYYLNSADGDNLAIINLDNYKNYFCNFVDIIPSRADLIACYGFMFNSSYSVGYSKGYTDGTIDVTNSMSNQYNIGYTKGYEAGLNSGGSVGEYSFFGLIGAIIDAPISYFGSLFDFNILGTNIRNFLLGLFTLSIVLVVVRLVLARKE